LIQLLDKFLQSLELAPGQAKALLAVAVEVHVKAFTVVPQGLLQ